MPSSIPITVHLNEGQIGEIARIPNRSNKTPARARGRVQVLADRKGVCGHCDACLRACPMDVPILEEKRSPACFNCGACVDACRVMLAPSGRPPVLGYAPAVGVTAAPLLVGRPVVLSVNTIQAIAERKDTDVYLGMTLENFRTDTLRGMVLLSGVPAGVPVRVAPSTLKIQPGGREWFAVNLTLAGRNASIDLLVKIVDRVSGKVVSATTIRT